MKTGVALMFAALAAVLCSGCAGVTAADRGPRGDPVARLAPTTPSPWREDFGDPVLRNLLGQADAGALDVKVALARLELADAEVESADAARGLNVVAGVEGAVGGRNLRTAGSAGTPTLEATKVFDVWGGQRFAGLAARSDRNAAQTETAGARLLVGAQTSRAYLSLRAATEAQASAARRQQLAARALELVTLRASLGTATERDVAARREAVRAAAAQVQQYRDEAGLQAARLADLTGRRAAITPSAGPLPIGAPPGPRPSTVVDARPDVQAAWARLAAADQRRASAIAASRPQFQITAALGAPDATLATLLDVRALAWAVAAGVTQQVLDGGALRAKIHAATAEADLADLAYRQAVLAAWSDVRAAVVADAQARRGLVEADAGVAAANADLRAGEARHGAGAADGLAMIELAQAAAQASLAASEAGRQVAEARIQLVLATGGG